MQRVRARALEEVGGRQRLRVILVLAAVLGLDYADRSVLGVAAPNIEHAFSIGNAQIGLLASAFAVVSALATVPVGMLTDHRRRTTLLGISVCLWSAAMVFVGAAQSYLWLFFAQMSLGVVTATGGPTVASLTGDLFSHRERGRVLGYIRSGELFGTGFGYIVTGLIASYLSWRYSFWALVPVSAFVAFAALRMREPERGANLEHPGSAGGNLRSGDTAEPEDEDLVEELVVEDDIVPDRRLILHGEQEHMSLWDAVRYVLRVRTNVIVLIASSIGDLFLSGVRVFIVVFIIHQYSISQGMVIALLPVVGAAAIAGMIAGGRIGDRLLRHDVLGGRILVGVVAYTLVAAALIPAALLHSLPAALPLFMIGAFALAAPLPALDAVRLDIIHFRVWGRAESVRTVLRTAADAGGPATIGLLSDVAFGGGHHGLQLAILVTLPLLIANGIVLLWALRFYPAEVAAAVYTEHPELEQPQKACDGALSPGISRAPAPTRPRRRSQRPREG